MNDDSAIQARQCWRKKLLVAETEAQRHAKVMHKRYKAPFVAYRCQWCGYWHVGTVRSKDAAVKREARRRS